MKKIEMTVKILFFFTLLVIFITGCTTEKYPEGIYAELETSKGEIVLLLEFEKTPMTVANFAGLAEGTIRNTAFPDGKPYFDGTKFHRVVPGHVIQAGEPNTDSGEGPGYTFPNEIYSGLSHKDAGALGMANGGPHTNSCQFYITLGDRSYLDGDYTVFGRVLEGMDVVDNIVQGDEVIKIKIVRIGKKAKRFLTDTKTFEELVRLAGERVLREEEQKKKKEEDFILENWPEAVTTASGLKYVVIKEGEGKIPEKGSKIRVIYQGRFIDGEKFHSTDDRGIPGSSKENEPFLFEVGGRNVNPGFDEAVAQMKKGEKRILIVPADLAYGRSGFYAQEKKGEKRFIISPNTSLIYEVEVLDFERMQ